MEYYVLSSSPHLKQVFDFIRTHNLKCEVHLNRTRFWLDTDQPYYLEFVLRWWDSCPVVDHTLDTQTGF
jgi:hypothetical protein